MIDYSKITQSKYLEFFTNEETKILEKPNAIMDDFLWDMCEISENILSDAISPLEVIRHIFENNEELFKGNGKLYWFQKIVILASSDNLKALSELELFALLWYCSCRNVFAYQEGYYVSMTKNGVIGKLLKALRNFLPTFADSTTGCHQGLLFVPLL